MTETKKTLYKTEDTIALGATLPAVAYKQLQRVVAEYDNFHDDRAMQTVRYCIEEFIKQVTPDYEDNDERALRRAFEKYKKKTPDLLEFYRQIQRTHEKLRKIGIS